jgi:hypothetical protein
MAALEYIQLIVGGVDLRAAGAAELWQRCKTAFVCSRRCPGTALLRAVDWVKTLDPSATVLLGGWHTPVEQEVLRLALRRQIPVIVAEARSRVVWFPPRGGQRFNPVGCWLSIRSRGLPLA